MPESRSSFRRAAALLAAALLAPPAPQVWAQTIRAAGAGAWTPGATAGVLAPSGLGSAASPLTLTPALSVMVPVSALAAAPGLPASAAAAHAAIPARAAAAPARAADALPAAPVAAAAREVDVLSAAPLSDADAPESGAAAPRSGPAAAELLRLASGLSKLQKTDGSWQEEVEADPSIDALTVLLMRRLPRDVVSDADHGLVLEQSLHRFFHWNGYDPKSGLWPAYPGGPADHDVTGMILHGTEAAGVSRADPSVARAWAWFESHGGVPRMNLPNRIFLAVAGATTRDLPAVPASILAIPRWIPLSPERLGLAKVALIPFVVWDYYRRAAASEGTRLEEPVSASSAASSGLSRAVDNAKVTWRQLRLGKDSAPGDFTESDSRRWSLGPVLALLARHRPRHPLFERHWAEKGLAWVIAEQQEGGTWAGVIQASYLSLLALHAAHEADGGDFSARMRQAWEGIKSWRAPMADGTIHQQMTDGPIMATARILTAVLVSPTPFELMPEADLRRAVDWLAGRQVVDPAGWRRDSRRAGPGGWPFERNNLIYPDIDDTAMAIEALARSPFAEEPQVRETIARGVRWMLKLQNRDGGFPAWFPNDSILLRLATFIPRLLFGLPDITDKSYPDVTSRVIQALTAVSARRGLRVRVPPQDLRRATDFLFASAARSPSGARIWPGQWMVAYLYGTAEATSALLESGGLHVEEAYPSIAWLAERQQRDGGWGESPEGARLGGYIQAAPTISQTAWVVSALLRYETLRVATGSSAPSVRDAIERGVAFLRRPLQGEKPPTELAMTALQISGWLYGRYGSLPAYETLRVLNQYQLLLAARNPVR